VTKCDRGRDQSLGRNSSSYFIDSPQSNLCIHVQLRMLLHWSNSSPCSVALF